MGLSNNGFGGNSFGAQTASAGTKISVLIPPYRGAITRLGAVSYTAGSTAHTITALRSIGRTKTSAAAASGQAVVNIVADPGETIGNALAANDWVAIREKDGVTRLYQVNSISTLAVTLKSNLVAGALAGADLWDFGLTTDTDPNTGLPHQAFAAAASATTSLTDSVAGVAASNAPDEPVVLQSNNATAAGTFNQVTFAYTKA